MNNYKKPLILLLILLGLGGFYYSARSGSQTISPPVKNTALESGVNLSVESGTETQSFDIAQFVGKTALTASQGVAKIETSGIGENAFVITINGQTADTKKREFWELVINGKEAEVGAGSYIIQNGDSILWKLSTY